MTEIGARTFYHGTKAELKRRDMLQGGYSSRQWRTLSRIRSRSTT